MKRFKNILFVSEHLEKEQESFNRAADLALRNEAKLTVIGAVEVSTLDALIDHKTLSLSDVQQKLREERSAQIQQVIANLDHDGTDISSKVILGGGFVEIVQEVLRNNHDLVIKSAESFSGMSSTWFASNDMHLMRKCPCPVWIVKPTGGRRYKRILAAVDTDPANSEQDKLNHLIMDLATSIAIKEDSELHVVHAWDLQGDDWMAARASLSKQQIQAIRQEVRERHQVAFDTLLADYQTLDVNMQTHLIEGRAGMVIPEQARRQEAGLIVMGTVARTGLPGFIIGNTAENVLGQVGCSVLTVKPQGFETPVRLAS